jgi:16S rRNA (cytosine967-C5)-methyltransferase
VSDPARRAAFDVVHAVSTADAYANLLLPRLLSERGLAGRDARFATELGYGTLRWRGSLDRVLAACSNRSLDELDQPVLDVLRLGSYQLLHTRVPARAAVDSSVELARELGLPRATGYVNAVLRRVSARDWAGWLDQLAADASDEPERVALGTGHPAWVVRAFAEAHRGDLAAAAASLSVDRPEVHLAALPGLVDRPGLLAQAGTGALPGPFSPFAVRLAAGGDPARLPAVAAGRAIVQDEASQLAVLALARAPVGAAAGTERWLDLCAGPGGKAALLARLGMATGAELLGSDVGFHRARLVRDRLVAAAAPPRVVVADGTRPAWPDGGFDRVLLDAPCSGLGALRRRPESRWRRTPADVSRLAELQRRLLAAACRLVRPGGVVGYVTCSPHPAETSAVVAEFAGRTELLTVPALLPEVPDLGAGPFAQFFPDRHGTDALFVALLRRTAS